MSLRLLTYINSGLGASSHQTFLSSTADSTLSFLPSSFVHDWLHRRCHHNYANRRPVHRITRRGVLALPPAHHQYLPLHVLISPHTRSNRSTSSALFTWMRLQQETVHRVACSQSRIYVANTGLIIHDSVVGKTFSVARSCQDADAIREERLDICFISIIFLYHKNIHLIYQCMNRKSERCSEPRELYTRNQNPCHNHDIPQTYRRSA